MICGDSSYDWLPKDVLERPRAYVSALNHVTLRRAPRGRPDLAGCLPRCVRTDGRVRLCGKIVPKLVEPHTFVQWVLKEEHSHQTFGQWRQHQSDGQSEETMYSRSCCGMSERMRRLSARNCWFHSSSLTSLRLRLLLSGSTNWPSGLVTLPRKSLKFLRATTIVRLTLRNILLAYIQR